MKKLLLSTLGFFMVIQGFGQKEIITLSFAAKDSITQNPLVLDSVFVNNVTLGCDTSLYNPVSDLSINILYVGINEPESQNTDFFTVMQNTPNPFSGSTLLRICLKKDGLLNLAVYDIHGKQLAEYRNNFRKGWHLFEVSTSGSRLLFLRVSDNTSTKTIKLLSTGAGSEDSRISYAGESGQDHPILKSVQEETGFVFYLGNQLQFTAYADGYYESILTDNPESDETYTFAMLPVAILPTVTTSPVTNIAQTTATSGGNVTSDGGATVTARGVCWNTEPNATIENNHTSDGSGTGTFVSNLTGLTANTPYFVRAYATNSEGTAYGNEVQFSTLPNASLPVVITSAATNITQTTATSGGNVTSDGGATVTARGVCWNTTPNPTIVNSHTTNGSGTGAFVSNLTALTPNTPYYIRAYATNSVGTAYGNQVNFTTLPAGFTCGSSLTITHVTGEVAPVDKTVTYGTVTNIPGEPSKCWITSNLGADHQATAKDDATEPSAGWYWQFNRKQGYKHDGVTRTPNTTWITSINENSNWTAANDPCTLELGAGWRIPTNTEWTNVEASGNWTNWNGPWNSALKMHAAGTLDFTNGSLSQRGSFGAYWSSAQADGSDGYAECFNSALIVVSMEYKPTGFTLRCLRESSSSTLPTVTTAGITNNTQTTATSGGNVTSDGGATVTARGVCWTKPNDSKQPHFRRNRNRRICEQSYRFNGKHTIFCKT